MRYKCAEVGDTEFQEIEASSHEEAAWIFARYLDENCSDDSLDASIIVIDENHVPKYFTVGIERSLLVEEYDDVDN